METAKKIGRYEILEELGEGAMGTVYRAKDPSMDRIVAVKTIISFALASSQGNEYRERFYRESRAAGRLTHPGIVAMFDVGEHDGLPFLVMEFVNGQTLDAAVKKGERLPLDRVCEICQQLAEALGYAHRQGVVHRDIKPANILLTSRETHGVERPKITDFGVAKLAAGQITASGQMLGTPAFMPPEQFTGAPIDGRADLFSLGVILFWMATGEQPFPGETVTSVSYKVVHTEPAPPRRLNLSIPEPLNHVILKCLAKSPAERYQTGEELAQDLAAIRMGMTTGRQGQPHQSAVFERRVDETLDLRPAGSLPLHPQTTSQAAAASPPATPGGYGKYAMAGAAVVLLVAGGWYVTRNKSGTTQMAPPAPPVNAVNSIPPPQPAQVPSPAPVVPVAKAAPAAKAEATSPAPKSASHPTAASILKTPPSSPMVDFDPKALNPKENARIQIDATRMPPGLDFTIELNGKTYFRRSAAGNKTEYDDLFVPPGVQEFRATAQKNDVRKESNAVSMDFKAKKKKTLKVELRSQGQPAEAGMPSDLYPDSQLVMTLK